MMARVDNMELSPLLCVQHAENLVGRERLAAEFMLALIELGIDSLQFSGEESGEGASVGGMIGLSGRDDSGRGLDSTREEAETEDCKLCHRLAQSGAIFAGSPLGQPLVEICARAAIGEDEMFDELTDVPTRGIADWMSLDIFGR